MAADRYTTGYRRPPQDHQFRKGVSGNPNGRPNKEISNYKDDVQSILSEKIYITENGKKSKTTKRSALLKKVINEAIRGDHRMVNFCIKLLESSEKRIDNQDFLNPPNIEIHLVSPDGERKLVGGGNPREDADF